MKNQFLLVALFLSVTFNASAKDQTMNVCQPWLNAVTAGKAGAAGLNRKSSKTADQVTIKIMGRCFHGPDTTKPIIGGTLKLCFNTVNPGFWGPATCDDWGQVYWECIIDSSGLYDITMYQNTGDYVAAVYLAPFALQWLDGAPISATPSRITVKDSLTLRYDLHFTDGCRVSGNVAIPPDSVGMSVVPTISLFDTAGTALFTVRPDAAGSFTFLGIPIGKYYVRMRYTDYFDNPFYPGTPYASSSGIISFSTPGETKAGISWTLHRKATRLLDSTNNAHITFCSGDTSHGLAALFRFIGSSEVSFPSTNMDTMQESLPGNTKLFIARLKDETNRTKISMSYYPGSFLRSEAETLSFVKNETRVFALPFAPGGQIAGYLPAFNNGNSTFDPMLVRPNSYASLGAEPYTDSSGYYNMWAPVGTYSLWVVPRTENYLRTVGWGAFRMDSIVVTNDHLSNISRMNSVWNTRTLEGTLSANRDPLIVCFDSLCRPVSMTVINLYDYFEKFTNDRWYCFYFDIIHAPPYNLSYAINFLPPGKYALVKAVPPDSEPGAHTISWLGGPTYQATIVSPDDVASLTVPQTVQWVRVNSADAVVDIGAWNTAIVKRNQTFDESGRIDFKVVERRLIVFLPVSHCMVSLKIYTISGKLIVNQVFQHLNEKKMQVPMPDFSSQILFARITVAGQVYSKSIVMISR